MDAGTILAGKDALKRMIPASMTKIFTVLVAAENIKPEQLDELVTISIDATDFSYSNDCSNTGYEVDEQVTVRDLFYGTILPSGADSAVSLATYVAGSQEAFVDMMNQELEKMGLSENTHFTNCVGIYNDDHYSTPYDMAMILKAAMDNDLCRKFLEREPIRHQNPNHIQMGLQYPTGFCGELKIRIHTVKLSGQRQVLESVRKLCGKYGTDAGRKRIYLRDGWLYQQLALYLRSCGYL